MKMMHHPNMHHQPMSGHPPQHLPGHQAMPAHHQMPPHQMHRENRVPLGPSQPGGGMGGHGQAMGRIGTAMGVPPPHHAPAQRPPHPIRAMPHHPPAQHHSVPPQQQMKPMRRPYAVSGGYGPSNGPSVMPPPYTQPPPMQPPPNTQANHTGLCRPSSPVLSTQTKLSSDFATTPPSNNATTLSAGASGEPVAAAAAAVAAAATAAGGTAVEGAGVGAGAGVTAEVVADAAKAPAAPGDGEAARPATATQANSKEKTPMCLVNELARYNKIKHQYRLTLESGPAHKKVFTVTLRLGDTEEYTAEGSSIKRAQHGAASAALAGTRYPPPPPRAPPAHHAHHAHAHTHAHAHRHSGAVMPTVELNALAMKLCQPAVYSSIPPVPAAPRMPRVRPAAFRLPFAGFPRVMGGGAAGGVGGVGVGVGGGVAGALVYRVRVCVGGRAWLGEGSTPQAARHDAAARALRDLRPPPEQQHNADRDDADAGADLLASEVKSPVSLVHELALKRNLSVQFTVKSERGPPHMRVFVTACTVGDMETEGEGNGKKVSKRRAAERMLDEMRRRWPPALLRARHTQDKRRQQPAKKKPRNLIKEGGAGGGGGGGGGGGACAGGAAGAGGGVGGGAGAEGGGDNPISRLAVARHALRARSPQYRVVEERGAARRREFVVQCDAPPHRATGLGPNKKTAKRRAAHNVLLAMEMANANNESTGASSAPAAADTNTNGNGDANKTNNNDTKRKESEAPAAGGANSEVRQPVPGVLLMDYHQRSGQPTQPNGVSETSATGGNGGNTPGAKDQLMYLSQLLGFTVQFSDFPKRNHGEYLSLVSLSTEPPVMCHGGGASTAHSHEQCARAALRSLALMGLDAPPHAHPAHTAHTAPHAHGMQTMPGQGTKPSVISNGITE